MEDIFKAYDVRGEIGNELNEDVYYKIGRAFGQWSGEKKQFVVGYDMRPTSAQFAKALTSGLIDSGQDVLNLGLVCTDMVYFAVGSGGYGGGAMVTASHNPSNYNGLKLCASEAKAIGLENGLDTIRDLVIENKFSPPSKIGSKKEIDVTEEWIAHALSFIDVNKLKPLKIAVDAGNGMAGKIFPELEPYVPFEVTELFFNLDGTFPNHEANPLKFETLETIRQVILKNKLDCGLAFDGDGDRAFLIDDLGEIVSGSETTAVIAEHFLKTNPGSKITYDVRVSKTVPEIIVELGGIPIRTKVGHAIIKKVMREQDAVFGGEQSGHYYFRDNWYADSGLIACLVALQVLSLSNKKLSELRKKYMRYHAIPETNFVLSSPANDLLIKFKSIYNDRKIDELDGLTVELEDGSWFNLRASNTEPLLRLNAESASRSKLTAMVDDIKKVL